MSGDEASSHACKFPLLIVARRPFTFHEQILTVLTAQVETEETRSATVRRGMTLERDALHSQATGNW
jgi:hypothetical protein